MSVNKNAQSDLKWAYGSQQNVVNWIQGPVAARLRPEVLCRAEVPSNEVRRDPAYPEQGSVACDRVEGFRALVRSFGSTQDRTLSSAEGVRLVPPAAGLAHHEKKIPDSSGVFHSSTGDEPGVRRLEVLNNGYRSSSIFFTSTNLRFGSLTETASIR